MPDPPQPTTRLGDWYGNTLNTGRQRLMIFVSDRSLLSIIMPLRERHEMLKNFKLRLAMLLLHLDVDVHLVTSELDQMETVVIAQTANKSVLGSMNDFSQITKVYLANDDSTDLHRVNHRLAQIPCGPINYQSPDQLTRILLSR